MENIKGFKNSFVVYDFFGYLLPGFFFCCLFIVDYDLTKVLNHYYNNRSLIGLERNHDTFVLDYFFKYLTWNSDSNFKFATLILFILFCYTLGHIIAAVSSFIIERSFNKNCLGFPSKNLLLNSKRTWFQRVFKNYTNPFEESFITDFNKVFEQRFNNSHSFKDKYWLCFSDIAKYLPTAYNRIIHFLNLYGFSRNVAAAFMIYLIIRLSFLWPIGSKIGGLNWIVLGIFLFAMLINIKNYLKLYYRQCIEVYYHFYSLHTDKKYFDKKSGEL